MSEQSFTDGQLDLVATTADFALVSQVFQAPWSPDQYAPDTVYARGLKQGPARLADVRGWGYLTGGGHGALGLDQGEARRIQDAMGRLIAAIPALIAMTQKAAAAPAMYEALKHAHDILLAAAERMRRLGQDESARGLEAEAADVSAALSQASEGGKA